MITIARVSSLVLSLPSCVCTFIIDGLFFLSDFSSYKTQGRYKIRHAWLFPLLISSPILSSSSLFRPLIPLCLHSTFIHRSLLHTQVPTTTSISQPQQYHSLSLFPAPILSPTTIIHTMRLLRMAELAHSILTYLSLKDLSHLLRTYRYPLQAPAVSLRPHN